MIWLALLCACLALLMLFQRLMLTRQASARSAEGNRLRDSSTLLAAQAANYRLKLNALTQSSGAGILMVDEKGGVVHSNTAIADILGEAPRNLEGAAELRDFALSAFRSGKPATTDVPLPNARSRMLRAFAYPFEVGLSGVPEVMLILTDVTELRRLENVRRDFVANVSHELRTPLASIRAMAEILQNGALDDPAVAEKFLETIVRETDRLERISSDLLVLSNTESGTPVQEDMDLGIVLQDVYVRYEPKAIAGAINLTLDAPESIPMVGSRDQIEQVVLNLVDNAIKYTPAGGRVTIQSSVDGSDIMVSVADTGIGIAESDLTRIFDRFYRADKSRAAQAAGTGLGLSIVKDVVESHGGTVQVTSQVRQGSTFTIRLPIERSQSSA